MGQSQSINQQNPGDNNINYISNDSSQNTINNSNYQNSIQMNSSYYNSNQELEQQLINTAFKWKFGGQNVCVTGSFTQWKNHVQLQRVANNEFQQIIRLPPAVHIYKFIVDGEWKFSPDDVTVADENGNINNIIDTSMYLQKQSSQQHQIQVQHQIHQKQIYQQQQQIHQKNQQQINKKYPKNNNQQNQIQHEQEWSNDAPLLPKAYKNIQFIQFKEHKDRLSWDKSLLNQNLKYRLVDFNLSGEMQQVPHVVLNHLGIFNNGNNNKSENNCNTYVFTHRFKAKNATIKFYTSKFQPFNSNQTNISPIN